MKFRLRPLLSRCYNLIFGWMIRILLGWIDSPLGMLSPFFEDIQKTVLPKGRQGAYLATLRHPATYNRDTLTHSYAFTGQTERSYSFFGSCRTPDSQAYECYWTIPYQDYARTSTIKQAELPEREVGSFDYETGWAGTKHRGGGIPEKAKRGE